MAQRVLTERRDKKGEIVGWNFNPTVKMRMWCIYRIKPEFKGMSDDAVARNLGMTESPVKYWNRNYKEHFIEWYQGELDRNKAPIKEMLLAVGKEMAMREDGFQYWRELSRSYGVISPEVIEQRVSIGRMVEKLDELSEEELTERQNKLLKKIQLLDSGQTEAEVIEETEEKDNKVEGFFNGNMEADTGI